jgi:hypothetical protein
VARAARQIMLEEDRASHALGRDCPIGSCPGGPR